MNEFLENDEVKKTIKPLNLDDFSIEDLNKYKIELKNEIKRVDEENLKKKKLLNEAQKFFK
tara:strand:- start:33 stop:215 length:183 start_codon:yes stop_codon:yes gene_type:complete